MKANQLYDKLENIDNNAADDLYYKCNSAEQILFELKSMVKNEELIKQLEGIIIELNDFRMTAYRELGGRGNENI